MLGSVRNRDDRSVEGARAVKIGLRPGKIWLHHTCPSSSQDNTPWHVLNRFLAGQVIVVGKSCPGNFFLEKLHINNHEPLGISSFSQFLVKALLKVVDFPLHSEWKLNWILGNNFSKIHYII